jgi:hypothetical protein
MKARSALLPAFVALRTTITVSVAVLPQPGASQSSLKGGQ